MVKTFADTASEIAPKWTWAKFKRWPPNVFALTSAILQQSGAYPLVVSPPDRKRWPPATWTRRVVRAGQQWRSAWTPRGLLDPPADLDRCGLDLWQAVRAKRPLAELTRATGRDLFTSLLTLHAMADEASAGLGVPGPDPQPNPAFGFQAELGLRAGSLATIPAERARVLPKLRNPRPGITLRSLSRHLAFDTSEVDAVWRKAPRPYPAGDELFNLLLVPWPPRVTSRDFGQVPVSRITMDPNRYGGFFEFSPRELFRPDYVLDAVRAAQAGGHRVDAVVLPESALTREQAQRLQRALVQKRVFYLITGVRSRARDNLGSNYVHLGVNWLPPRAAVVIEQHKHHRWLLDGPQIRQYHLETVLDPAREWWEAINVEPRRVHFLAVSPWLTICPLVCEDLARIDPVAGLVRAVGPSLVVAILLDGPQLASRWPARYASVLADDPGSAVLTLTSIGMATRSWSDTFPPSRVMAMWKDPQSQLKEVFLAPGHRAVLLRLHGRMADTHTADGRLHRGLKPELVLEGEPVQVR